MRVSIMSCWGRGRPLVVKANDSSGAGNVVEKRVCGKAVADATVFVPRPRRSVLSINLMSSFQATLEKGEVDVETIE